MVISTETIWSYEGGCEEVDGCGSFTWALAITVDSVIILEVEGRFKLLFEISVSIVRVEIAVDIVLEDGVVVMPVAVSLAVFPAASCCSCCCLNWIISSYAGGKSKSLGLVVPGLGVSLLLPPVGMLAAWDCCKAGNERGRF